jgi:hypothetical protein
VSRARDQVDRRALYNPGENIHTRAFVTTYGLVALRVPGETSTVYYCTLIISTGLRSTWTDELGNYVSGEAVSSA